MISEKKEAASMTPAANPNAKSRTPRFGLLVNKIGSAPTAVIKPAARLPNTPIVTRETSSIPITCLVVDE
ncbi:hypothetical protein HAALTHF_07070n [Vreelandella aquamarina]|jgi:hypothetical protein|nr:hypothetical protein HAALTHF_07070n [Halomonas axialensis]